MGADPGCPFLDSEVVPVGAVDDVLIGIFGSRQHGHHVVTTAVVDRHARVRFVHDLNTTALNQRQILSRRIHLFYVQNLLYHILVHVYGVVTTSDTVTYIVHVQNYMNKPWIDESRVRTRYLLRIQS